MPIKSYSEITKQILSWTKLRVSTLHVSVVLQSKLMFYFTNLSRKS